MSRWERSRKYTPADMLHPIPAIQLQAMTQSASSQCWCALARAPNERVGAIRGTRQSAGNGQSIGLRDAIDPHETPVVRSSDCSFFQVMSNKSDCGLRRCRRVPAITMDENERDRAFG